jgi:hypothetical protein
MIWGTPYSCPTIWVATCLMEFYTSLTLFYTKISFKNLKFSNRPSVFFPSNLPKSTAGSLFQSCFSYFTRLFRRNLGFQSTHCVSQSSELLKCRPRWRGPKKEFKSLENEWISKENNNFAALGRPMQRFDGILPTLLAAPSISSQLTMMVFIQKRMTTMTMSVL